MTDNDILQEKSVLMNNFIVYCLSKQWPIKLFNFVNISVAVDPVPSHVSVSRGTYLPKKSTAALLILLNYLGSIEKRTVIKD